MPDPTKDLADIVEPQIPTVAQASGDWLLIAATAVIGIALVAALYWHWRRRAPLRRLQRLRARRDLPQAAGELATLLPRFKRAPEPAWLDALQGLRFGPPQDDAQAVFERLCREAATLLQGRP